MKDRIKYPYAFTWATLAVIAVLTLMPAPEAPEEVGMIPHADKIVHFLMFGFFAAVWWWEYSLRRGYPAAPWRALVPVVVAVALIAGFDELLQGALTADRSADLFDWIADVCGAIIFPAASKGLIDRLLPADAVRLVNAVGKTEITADMERLYLDSFPPEERREWQDIVERSRSSDHPLHFTFVTRRGEAAGFITWWQFSKFRYVEHFAIRPAMRGGGIGAKAMKLFVGQRRTPVVLEVELPAASEMAERRVHFYERCGFTAHPGYEYIQPPYAEGLPSVPLMLMTSASGKQPVDLKAVDRTLKVMVYNVQPDF